jgi:hypothetical protein
METTRINNEKIMDKLKVSNYKVNDSFVKRLIKIVTPFSMYFWIMIFLIVTIVLVNKYVISHVLTNLILITISLVILFA